MSKWRFMNLIGLLFGISRAAGSAGSLLYDAKVISSGDPKRIGKRVVKRIIRRGVCESPTT